MFHRLVSGLYISNLDSLLLYMCFQGQISKTLLYYYMTPGYPLSSHNTRGIDIMDARAIPRSHSYTRMTSKEIIKHR